MTSIRITNFGGMRKRNSRGLQDPVAASLAKDVKLWHGTVAAWRYPAKFIETDLSQICNISKLDCSYVVSSDPCESFTFDPQCRRVFRSTPDQPLRWAILPEETQCESVANLDWFELGVAAPPNIPQITASDPLTPRQGDNQVDYSHQFDRESRTYGITYVNSLGEESSMTVNPEPVDVDTSGSATIEFFNPAALQGQYDIVAIRVYRGLAVHQNQIVDQSNPDAPSSSGFFFVDEFDFVPGEVTFVDDLDAEDIGEMYVQHSADVPEIGLENITMTDSGSLVASKGKHLWFSEPFNYHAWNCFMNFDHCIEAIGVVGNSIYLATNGNAYVLNDTVNQDECRCCRTVATINEPTPIACRKSFVVTPTGVIFATNTGLVRITGEGMQYISLGFYGEDQWGEWMPHNLTGAYYKGSYFGFNGHKSFIYDVSEGYYASRNVGEQSMFTELSLTPDAVFVTKQNELVMSFQGDLFKWDESDVLLPYTWRSRLNVEGGTTNLGYGKVVFEDYIGRRPVPNPVMFRLYADDRKVYERRVSDSTIFTLPRGYDALNYELEIEGIQTVMEIHLASTKRELTLLNNV